MESTNREFNKFLNTIKTTIVKGKLSTRLMVRSYTGNKLVIETYIYIDGRSSEQGNSQVDSSIQIEQKDDVVDVTYYDSYHHAYSHHPYAGNHVGSTIEATLMSKYAFDNFDQQYDLPLY